MNRLPKHGDGFVSRLSLALAIHQSRVELGRHQKGKTRQQHNQVGHSEPVFSLSPHVPSGHFRALFNTGAARIPLPHLFGLFGDRCATTARKRQIAAVPVPHLAPAP